MKENPSYPVVKPASSAGRWRKFVFRIPLHIIIIVISLLWLTPTVGLLVSSFRPATEIASAAGGQPFKLLLSLHFKITLPSCRKTGWVRALSTV
jgi:ABC-type glycerol-3-phosphate transport system permease component